MPQLPTLPSWQQLKQHWQAMQNTPMRDLFAENSQRFNNFSLEVGDILLDYSKQRITSETRSLLCQLAKESELQAYIERMFGGEKINNTEQRAVLHTALRQPQQTVIRVDNENIMPSIQASLQRMAEIVVQLHSGAWQGYQGQPITDVVNLGIGGSDLGPAMVTEALHPYQQTNIAVHFVSNVDATQLFQVLDKVNPATTLFIITSKTFTTMETMTNANTARQWLQSKLGEQCDLNQHFLAITANPQRALEYGIRKENVLTFSDWVGGRYSLWSVVGLPIAIAIGMQNFQALLQGAYEIDQHFRHAEFEQNLPVLLALLGIWNINFANCKAHAVSPYTQYLARFPAYLQQVDMESNGKQVNRDGEKIDYQTAPIIWGELGSNGQHAFHQALLQGQDVVPVDFIMTKQCHHDLDNHQTILMAACLSQSRALMQGKDLQEVEKELQTQGLSKGEIATLAPHKVIPGNRPSNTLVLKKLTPRNLGALIAIYEHKVFTQGVIWQINSFDQWGVELGKQIAKELVDNNGQAKTELASEFDSSTQGLWQFLIS